MRAWIGGNCTILQDNGGTVDAHMEGNFVMNTLQMLLCLPSLDNCLEYLVERQSVPGLML